MEHWIVAGLVMALGVAVTCAQMFYHGERAAEASRDSLLTANQRQQTVAAAQSARLEETEVKLKTEQSEREYYEKLARTFEKEVLAIAAGRS